jgi:hypothetical protein
MTGEVSLARMTGIARGSWKARQWLLGRGFQMRLYRISFVAGLAVGFVAGTRAGRERYDQMIQMAKTTRENPTFQQAMGTIQSQATDLLSTAQHKVAEGVPQLAHAAAHKVDDMRHRNGHGSGNGKAAANGKGGEGRPFATTGSGHFKHSSH